MAPGGIGYSDAPTFGGFNSKPPLSLHAMELADLEAAFVGNLARYCMAMGTIPPYSLRGLWWINKECKGLAVTDWDSDVELIQGLINHLIRYAPFIVGTEGVEDILENGRSTRWYGEKMFPNEAAEWVTTEQACEITGRSAKTINDWRRQGWVETLNDDHGMLFLRAGIENIVAALSAKRTSNLPNGKPMIQ